MKKLVLATAVAALSITAAQAAPTVYGKAFLTVDAATHKAKGGDRVDERTKLNSNASRIGVKGAEALTANTDLVYQLEYRVDIDSDAARNFESRDTFIGLSNKQYGTLLAGRLTAIDGRVDYANVAQGAVIGGDNVLAAVDAKRANNAFAYVSPNFNGFTASAMYTLEESKNDAYAFNNTNAWGLAAQYEPEGQPFRAGASYIQADEIKAIRVSGAYDVTPAATVGALYQNTQLAKGGEKENAFTVSGSYKTATPWTVYGQVDYLDNAKGAKDIDVTRLVTGGKYAFNKATTGHVYAGYMHTKAGNNAPVASGKVNSGSIGGGIEYKF